MWMLLACSLCAVSQADGTVQHTTFDSVVRLEIAAEDAPLAGHGPATALEYTVEFDGSLHLWTRAAADLLLRTEDMVTGVASEDDDSGGGDAPFLTLAVARGDRLTVLVAAKDVADVGPLELHLVAAPESPLTRAAARSGRERLREAHQRRAEDVLAARALLAAQLEDLLAVEGALTSAAVVQALEELSTLARDLGDLPTSHRARLAAHAALERLLPPDHARLLQAKVDLAIADYYVGDLDGALVLQRHIVAARERLFPAEHPDVLDARQSLAIMLKASGDLDGALALYRELLAVRERLLPEEHRDLWITRQNLAGALLEVGDARAALALLEQGLAFCEELPVDHPDRLRAQYNLAAARYSVGDLGGALALSEQVLACRARSFPADHPDVLSAKEVLAATRLALGDLEGARALAEQVLEGCAHTLPSDHRDVLAAKRNLAVTRSELGDVQGACALLEEVHSASERLFPPDHPSLLSAKLNLANARRQLDDFEGALALELRVQEAQERLLPPDHPDLLHVKLNLAATYGMLGDPQRAVEYLEHVHAARERTLPTGHPDRFSVAVKLAVARERVGDREGALALTRSLLASQIARAHELRMESSRFARAVALSEQEHLSTLLFLSDAAVGPARAEFDTLLFEALEGLRAASIRSVDGRSAHSQESAELREQLAHVRSELSNHGLAPPEDAIELAAWRARLFALSEERDRLGRSVQRALVAAGAPREVSAAAAAAGLEPGAVLISFYHYPRRAAVDPLTQRRPPPVDSLLAFVLTGDARVRRVELGASQEIEQLSASWRALLGAPLQRGIGAVTTQDEEVDVGRALRARLIDPCLAPLDAPPTRLHVILDDFLHLIPVDALPTASGERLGATLAVRLENSTRRLIAPPRPAAGTGTLVALGGVDFDADRIEASAPETGATATPPTIAPRTPPSTSTDRSPVRGAFEPLIQSRYEAEALGGMYEELVGADPVVLTRREASKGALHELAPRARFLHIATHGWFAPETFKSMIDSAGELGQRDLFVRADETLRGFAPETLCGLALAGANHGANAAGKVPGIMTAEELATLDLSGCELAVLSACETNVGIHRAGQGIQSLQAALHTAGARTAVTSLWRVDDAATRRLMEIFYTRLWKDGVGKAEALWGAKMALASEGHPVRDWAGWVLTGDPD